MDIPLQTPLDRQHGPGARMIGAERAVFQLWAPSRETLELLLEDGRVVPMERDPQGFFRVEVEPIAPGTRYRYRIDGDKERPDPASRWQPEGVHGPSAVVDPNFEWHDEGWVGPPLIDYAIYELHVGTFTAEGTFEAVIPHLAHLRELGITAIEIMPVAHFPGERNWGYDGVYLYAPHPVYGGVNGLKQLVDACHREGLAVILDVVYNHFGPEGNYMWDYAPEFFTDRYQTPWGDAINYDGPNCDGVRHFVIANALEWLRDYHIDGLRLDAIHAIYDLSAEHILAELSQEVERFCATSGRRHYLIAESDLNDTRIIRPHEQGGYGIDAQWADDFHHALHALLTGERNGYYADFGELQHLVLALSRAFTYAGDYAPHRRRRHGNSTAGCKGQQFVICTQNHDQVGNRALGDRLTASLSQAELRLAAGAMLLAPYIPLLFMGEEYAELAPFQYFTDHQDPALVEGVREGRKREFAAFVNDPAEVPDPQAQATFERSRLDHALREQGQHQQMWRFYQRLLSLRRSSPALAELDPGACTVSGDDTQGIFWMRRAHPEGDVLAIFNMTDQPQTMTLDTGAGPWEVLLDSADQPWADEPAPAQLEQRAGRLSLTLAAHSFVALQC